jgi:hypothetical protein
VQSRLDLALFGYFPEDEERSLRQLTRDVWQRHFAGSGGEDSTYIAPVPLLVYRLCTLSSFVVLEEVPAGRGVPFHGALPVVVVMRDAKASQVVDVTAIVRSAIVHGRDGVDVKREAFAAAGDPSPVRVSKPRLLVCATPKGGNFSVLQPLVAEGQRLPLENLVLGASDGRELTQQILAHYATVTAHTLALEEAAAKAALDLEEEVAREAGALFALLERYRAFPQGGREGMQGMQQGLAGLATFSTPSAGWQAAAHDWASGSSTSCFGCQGAPPPSPPIPLCSAPCPLTAHALMHTQLTHKNALAFCSICASICQPPAASAEAAERAAPQAGSGEKGPGGSQAGPPSCRGDGEAKSCLPVGCTPFLCRSSRPWQPPTRGGRGHWPLIRRGCQPLSLGGGRCRRHCRGRCRRHCRGRCCYCCCCCR